MKVRMENTSEFYTTALRWWAKHEFPAVHSAFLPKKVFIVDKQGIDLYSCFFYNTDSALCWLAYPISNLEAPKELKSGALEFLFLEIEKYAKRNNYYLMFTTTPNKSIMDTLEATGYAKGDASVDHYFKPVV